MERITFVKAADIFSLNEIDFCWRVLSSKKKKIVWKKENSFAKTCISILKEKSFGIGN